MAEVDDRTQAAHYKELADQYWQALVKVRAHTGYFPDADRALLAGLLASIERITDAALARTDELTDASPTRRVSVGIRDA